MREAKTARTMKVEMMVTAPGIIAAVEQIAEPVGHSLSFEREGDIVADATKMRTTMATTATMMKRNERGIRIPHPHEMNPANRVVARVAIMNTKAAPMSCEAMNTPTPGTTIEMFHCQIANAAKAVPRVIRTIMRLNISISVLQRAS